jgi:hypothetical protein
MYGIEVKTNPEFFNKKKQDMKTLTISTFTEFVLSNEEMINIRGGNGGKTDTGVNPTRPPVIIEV